MIQILGIILMPYKTSKEMIDSEYIVRIRINNSISTESDLYLSSMWSVGSTDVGRIPSFAGSFTGGGLAGQGYYKYTRGAISYRNAPVGKYNYLTSILKTSVGTASSTHMLADRLWANTGIIITGNDPWTGTINSVEWPARDDSGLASGYGVYIGLECGTSATRTSTVNEFTRVEYTNTENVPYRTGYIEHLPSTVLQGTFLPMCMDFGDKGVKSIQSIVIPTHVTGAPNQATGTFHLVAYRPIVIATDNNYIERLDFYNFGPKKIHNDSCLFLLYGSSTSYNPSYELGFIIN